VNKKIGERIRQLRLVKGYNQDNVAEELNMSAGNYGKIERGEVALTVDKLQRICQILQVSISDILDDHTITTATTNVKANKNLYSPVSQAEFQLLVKEVEVLYEKVENINLKLKH
jgi:transcriptional regulator with XRE-family HTH domain